MLLLMTSFNPATAVSLGEALTQEAELALHLRSFHLQRERSLGPENLAWTAGGELGYRSGWVGDTLRIGLTGYTSQKILGPADKDGTALLLPGQRAYSVLGESYLKLRHDTHELTAGRFLVRQFEINPQDTRMTPRSYEGIALSGTLSKGSYFLGRFDRMKPRNADRFESVARLAGAPEGVEPPLWQLSVRLQPGAHLQFGLSHYRLGAVLSSDYLEARGALIHNEKQRLELHAQHFRQHSDAASPTWNSGLKLAWQTGPLTLAGIVTQTGRGAAYRTPFGSWIGHTSRIFNNFNRAGEQALAIDTRVDFASLGLPGLTLLASATTSRHALAPATQTALSRDREYDLTLDYRFNTAAWPRALHPLQLRGRSARIEQREETQKNVIGEYQLILNYCVEIK